MIPREKAAHFIALLAIVVGLLGIWLWSLGDRYIIPGTLTLAMALVAAWALIDLRTTDAREKNYVIVVATLLAIVGLYFFERGYKFPIIFMIAFGALYIWAFAFWTLVMPKTEEHRQFRSQRALVVINGLLALVGLALYNAGMVNMLSPLIFVGLSLVLVWSLHGLLR